DIRPEEPSAHRPSLLHVVVVKGADSVLEVAPDRWIERAGGVPAVDPPDRRLPALRIERAQGHCLIRPVRLVEQVLVDVDAVHEVAIATPSVEIDPRPTVGSQLVVAHAPLPHEEVEVELVRATGWARRRASIDRGAGAHRSDDAPSGDEDSQHDHHGLEQVSIDRRVTSCTIRTSCTGLALRLWCPARRTGSHESRLLTADPLPA